MWVIQKTESLLYLCLWCVCRVRDRPGTLWQQRAQRSSCESRACVITLVAWPYPQRPDHTAKSSHFRYFHIEWRRSAAATLALITILLLQVHRGKLLSGWLAAWCLVLELLALAEGGRVSTNATTTRFCCRLVLDLFGHGVKSHIDVLGFLGTRL